MTICAPLGTRITLTRVPFLACKAENTGVRVLRVRLTSQPTPRTDQVVHREVQVMAVAAPSWGSGSCTPSLHHRAGEGSSLGPFAWRPCPPGPAPRTPSLPRAPGSATTWPTSCTAAARSCAAGCAGAAWCARLPRRPRPTCARRRTARPCTAARAGTTCGGGARPAPRERNSLPPPTATATTTPPTPSDGAPVAVPPPQPAPPRLIKAPALPTPALPRGLSRPPDPRRTGPPTGRGKAAKLLGRGRAPDRVEARRPSRSDRASFGSHPAQQRERGGAEPRGPRGSRGRGRGPPGAEPRLPRGRGLALRPRDGGGTGRGLVAARRGGVRQADPAAAVPRRAAQHLLPSPGPGRRCHAAGAALGPGAPGRRQPPVLPDAPRSR